MEQLHGPVNSLMELLFLPSTQQQSETIWMNVCPILASAIDSSKQKHQKKIFPIPQKPQISKKKIYLESI